MQLCEMEVHPGEYGGKPESEFLERLTLLRA